MPGCTVTVRSSALTRQHAVHAAHVDADAALHGQQMAFQRGAGAVGDHGHGRTGRPAARHRPRPACFRHTPRRTGGGAWMEPSSRPCCSHTAWAVEHCLPKRDCSACRKAGEIARGCKCREEVGGRSSWTPKTPKKNTTGICGAAPVKGRCGIRQAGMRLPRRVTLVRRVGALRGVQKILLRMPFIRAACGFTPRLGRPT